MTVITLFELGKERITGDLYMISRITRREIVIVPVFVQVQIQEH
jgi:hypothetical protein